MDACLQETLAFLDGVHRRGRHPYAEFLDGLRSAPRVCIFGAGEWAANVYEKLTRPDVGVTVHCCADNDARKWGRTFFGGVPCISLPELVAAKEEVAVLIITEGHCRTIYPQLQAAGIRNLHVITKEYLIPHADELRRRVCDAERYAVLRREVADLLELLADDLSRRTAATVIRNWFTFAPFEQDYLEINVPDQYFPADVIRLSERESFVDLGAYDGKNSLDFIARTNERFHTVYAFELDGRNFEGMAGTFAGRVAGGASYAVREVLSPAAMPAAADGTVFLCRFGAGACRAEIRYRSQLQASAIDRGGDCTAEIARLDDVLAGQPATLLKMDIEGAEMEALRGARETIRRWRPKVAACVYHHPDHLLQIPRFLKELVPEYRLYLRHHTNTDLETVCYATC